MVPKLADQGIYIASESSFYRVLHEVDQVNRRGKAQLPKTVSKPKGFKATAPNQVWSWDITFLASVIFICSSDGKSSREGCSAIVMKLSSCQLSVKL